jgi:hypothetical protein
VLQVTAWKIYLKFLFLIEVRLHCSENGPQNGRKKAVIELGLQEATQ